MIEPAAYGAAVLFGPNTRNFQDVVDALLERGGARVVADGSDLAQRLTELLDDPATAHSLGDAARGLVLARQGATRFTVDVLQELLPIELLERTDDDTETVAADAA
jgi:3-deoxy-D-manno-octulosonic-acid transferase